MIGFVGGVKEITNLVKPSKGAIRKSCSGNLLRYGWVARCSFATGTGGTRPPADFESNVFSYAFGAFVATFFG